MHTCKISVCRSRNEANVSGVASCASDQCRLLISSLQRGAGAVRAQRWAHARCETAMIYALIIELFDDPER